MTAPLHDIARVETPLGPVRLSVRVLNGDSTQMSIAATVRDVDPQLPAGMRAERTVSLDLTLTAHGESIAAIVEVALDSEVTGTPETGQWLEAVAFGGAGTLVNLATRDAAWMLSYGVDKERVPARWRTEDAQPDNAAWRVTYTPRGLAVATALAKGEAVNCPFAVAFVSVPDADPASSWFAVDIALP